MRQLCVLGMVGLCLCACGDKQNPVTRQDDSASTDQGSITYADPIKGLLDTRCTGCHASSRAGSDRHGAPLLINFDTYAEARRNAELANQEIQSGGMPPSGALPDAEKQTFQAWLDQGLKE